MSRIERSGNPAWIKRADKLLGYLDKHPGSTIPQLEQRLPWSGELLRHVLAAAHPAALELDGRWYTAAQCSRKRPARPVDDRRLWHER